MTRTNQIFIFVRYNRVFVTTEFVITEFVITEFVITEFVITEFVITEFVINENGVGWLAFATESVLHKQNTRLALSS